MNEAEGRFDGAGDEFQFAVEGGEAFDDFEFVAEAGEEAFEVGAVPEDFWRVVDLDAADHLLLDEERAAEVGEHFAGEAAARVLFGELGGEGLDAVEGLGDGRLVVGEYDAFAEDIGDDLQALGARVLKNDGGAFEDLLGFGVDADGDFFGFELGVGALNSRLELAEEFVLFEWLDVEKDDSAVAKNDSHPAATDADGEGAAAEALRGAEGAEVDPLADEDGSGGELAGCGAKELGGHGGDARS